METGNIIVDTLSTEYRNNRTKLNNLISARSFCRSELNTEIKYCQYKELEDMINNYNKEIEALENYIDGIHDARELVMKLVIK